jgi:hypothetical protein
LGFSLVFEVDRNLSAAGTSPAACATAAATALATASCVAIAGASFTAFSHLDFLHLIFRFHLIASTSTKTLPT